MAGELPASSLLPGAGESPYYNDVFVCVVCTALFSLFLTPLLLPLSPQVPRIPQRSLWTQCWQMCGPCRVACPASATTCISCPWDLPRLLDPLLPRYLSILCFCLFCSVFFCSEFPFSHCSPWNVYIFYSYMFLICCSLSLNRRLRRCTRVQSLRPRRHLLWVQPCFWAVPAALGAVCSPTLTTPR